MGEHVPDMVNLTALDEESMNNNLKLRFDEAGITIPFPQREVHVRQPAAPAAEAAPTFE